MTQPNTSTSKVPLHTFAEGVTVNGKPFILGQWYRHPVEIDTIVVPFLDQNGRPHETWASYPGTLATVRKAVIAIVKKWDQQGMVWDRMKS